jgi:hypothetical protein
MRDNALVSIFLERRDANAHMNDAEAANVPAKAITRVVQVPRCRTDSIHRADAAAVRKCIAMPVPDCLSRREIIDYEWQLNSLAAVAGCGVFRFSCPPAGKRLSKEGWLSCEPFVGKQVHIFKTFLITLHDETEDKPAWNISHQVKVCMSWKSS